MDCQGCVYYKYESDTNFSYCTNPKQEFEGQIFVLQENDSCELRYAVDDAKADARYGHRDKY